ncbi:hypothetical protein [Methylobacterium sp. Gmos1]
MEEIAQLRTAYSGDFSVTQRPEPIPGDLRIGWGQALLLLIIASSRGQRCSIQKIHFLAHVSRTAKLRQQLRDVLARRRGSASLPVRIEPWVNRAAAYAAASGLITFRDGKALNITETGSNAVKALREAKALEEEDTFLLEVGKRTTEKVVENIIKMDKF